jgi:hypothetical protein
VRFHGRRVTKVGRKSNAGFLWFPALAKGKSQPDSITVREAAIAAEGDPRARRRQIVELLQCFEGNARALKLTIGWGDMEPREIERLRKALAQIAAAAATHLEGIPKEFKAS